MTLPIKDTIEITSLQRTLCKAPKVDFPIVLIHFLSLKSGQPLYSGQITWSQFVLYREVSLYRTPDGVRYEESGITDGGVVA